MKLSGQLSLSGNQTHSCIVKTDLDSKNSLLYLRAKRNKTLKEGEKDCLFIRRHFIPFRGFCIFNHNAISN